MKIAIGSGWTFLAIVAGIALGEDSKSVSFEADVKPILREHCLKCHGDDTHKADLNLQTYSTLLKGGSGGEVVAAGRPGGSVLYKAISREGDAAPMPPNGPKLPEAQLSVVRRWIEGGLKESPSGASAIMRRNLDFKPTVASTDAGPGAMPEGLPGLEPSTIRRPHPVTAMACSPRAPLVAVAGHERILLYHATTRVALGAIAFPEGVPFVLRFSRDGRVLLAAGGRPVRSGKVVLFDVRSGRRLAEVGDEVDSVMAADISPDQRSIALGGSGKIVKVFSTSDGRLSYTINKHTDWITALAFSPDGAKLASADRSGAVHLWDSANGGIILALSEHKDSVGALDWRGDGEVLATGGEDGKLILWDARAGWPSVSLDAPHRPRPLSTNLGRRPAGVLDARFLPDGRLVTAGRDRAVRLWDGSGRPLAAFETPTVLPLKVAASFDGKTLIAGDSAGEIHQWPIADQPSR